jgi:hypothetical protein
MRTSKNTNINTQTLLQLSPPAQPPLVPAQRQG